MPRIRLAPTPPALELVERFRGQPAPLLPVLHELQRRRGWLHEDDLATVAQGLAIPEAALYGVVTFYHYFRLGPGDPAGYYCDGPACRMARSAGAPPTGTAIPCPGRCDDPPARLDDRCSGPATPSRPFVPTAREPILLRDAGRDDQVDLAAARGRGAWSSWERARHLDADALLDELQASGLAGRGGAGFPTALKWRAVREAIGQPKYVVVNADEGEPITFKDRPILERDPHLLLEGVRIAAHVVGAAVGIVYLRYEYPEAEAILERAIAEATAAGLLDGCALYVRRGAGAYICGEETSLLNSLEGRRPVPRDKPPYPTTHGFDGRPTLVNNVETLAAVPRIVERGGAWWRAHQPKLYSIAGDVAAPGNYELPLGTTARDLIAAAGGAVGGEVQFFTLGGLSGGLLGVADLDLALDFTAPKGRGAMLGSGGVLVGNHRRCPVDLGRLAADFFHHESCGKCFPCRLGSERSLRRLEGLAAGRGRPQDLDELAALARLMERTSACGLGVAAPTVTRGLLARFPELVEAHLAGRCPAGVCAQEPAR